MLKRYEAALAIALAVSAIPVFSRADSSVSVNKGDRYVTVQTYWSEMSEADRQRIVGSAVASMQNEVAQKAPILKNATLSNYLLSSSFADQVATELRRYLDDTTKVETSKNRVVRVIGDVLPHAVLVTGGGSADFHWTGGAGASMDVGLVVMFPSWETVIDTAQRDANGKPVVIVNDKFKIIDAAIVGIPHGYAGVGYGGGLSASIGIAGIWPVHGSMNSASDFHGVLGAISTTAAIPLPQFLPFPDGGDIDVGLVINQDAIFALARLAADKGAEAKVTIDGEGGDVIPLQSLVAPIANTKSWVKSVVGDIKGAFTSDKDDSAKNKKDSTDSKDNGDDKDDK